MATITLNEVKERLYDKKMVELWATDYETGMAYAEGSEPEASKRYFSMPTSYRAEQIAEHIQRMSKAQLVEQICKVLNGEF